MDRKQRKSRSSSNSDSFKKLILDGCLTFYLRSVIFTAHCTSEQELRDKSFLLHTIDEEFDYALMAEAEERYIEELDSLNERREDEKINMRIEHRRLINKFWDELREVADEVNLVVKPRQLKWILERLRMSPEEGGHNWTGDLCHVAVSLLDTVRMAPDYEEPVDTNDDIPVIERVVEEEIEEPVTNQ